MMHMKQMHSAGHGPRLAGSLFDSAEGSKHAFRRTRLQMKQKADGPCAMRNATNEMKRRGCFAMLL